MIRASGRAALTLVAGLFLVVGGVSQAAPASSTSAKSDSASNATETEKSTKHRRHYAHHRSSRTADKSSDDKKDNATAEAPASSAMPPAVANANAQVADATTPTAVAASAMTDRANDNVQAAADNTAAAPAADGQVVASDQLNDVDRALQQDSPAAQKPAASVTDAQPRPAPVMAASHGETSAWDQSSLIGKIFIGFGALLTLASAARMFMA